MSFNGGHNQLLEATATFAAGPSQDYPVMHATLYEIQKAELGRKFAKIDRRPLDPPPVVLLKLFTAGEDGSQREIDPAKQPPSVGRLCTVDLFPVSPLEYHSALKAEKSQSGQPSSPTSPEPGTSGLNASLSEIEQKDQTLVKVIDGERIYEYMKLTQHLIGQRQSQPTVMDWEGSKSLMFVFNDLSVKLEGYFFLRYRTFDITSAGTDYPAEAECFGGTFRVFSTKEFPGLGPSTELTKDLALRGVRVNVREMERKRRRKGHAHSGED
jgi:hypothetical protein